MQEAAGDFLTLADIAARVGWTVTTARTAHKEATARRRAATSRPGDLPEPDGRFGRTPVWRSRTIAEWESRRPGRGAGGGRPRK